MLIGRETLASYLDMAERADWKACVRPEEVETAECDEVRGSDRCFLFFVLTSAVQGGL